MLLFTVRCRVFLTPSLKTESGVQRLQAHRHKTTKPKNFTDYNSLVHLPKPHVPPVFNFAKDVLDIWETREKVLNCFITLKYVREQISAKQVGFNSDCSRVLMLFD